MTLRDKIAHTVCETRDVDNWLVQDSDYELADAVVAVIREGVRPLDFPERRNGYWGVGKGLKGEGYQIAHTHGRMFRVRLNGRGIKKDVDGLEAAIKWANEHHASAVLSAIGIDQ